MKSPLIILFMFATLAQACKKSNGDEKQEPQEPPAPPVISTVMPLTGPKNTPVTITGNHFGTNAALVKVYFNDVESAVTKVEATKIECTVPAKAGTGLVKVVVGSQTLTGPQFVYVYSSTVSTVAGSTEGFADGTGTAAKFAHPAGIAIDAQGNIIVADGLNNHSVRKVTPAGVVTTLARDATGVQMDHPYGVALDAQGNIYVADNGTSKILKITPSGSVSTFAGSGIKSHKDGIGTAAHFAGPTGVAVDAQGNVYVADLGNSVIRKITPAGAVSTLAGKVITGGNADGTGDAARFYGPIAVAVDNQGNVYVADSENHNIRKVTQAGVVTTIAGTGIGGYADGAAATARFTWPRGVAVDAQGNVYVADDGNSRIRKITQAGVVSTVAGTGVAGHLDGDAATAKFWWPDGVAVDAQGNVYVGDTRNYRIRKITME